MTPQTADIIAIGCLALTFGSISWIAYAFHFNAGFQAWLVRTLRKLQPKDNTKVIFRNDKGEPYEWDRKKGRFVPVKGGQS